MFSCNFQVTAFQAICHTCDRLVFRLCSVFCDCTCVVCINSILARVFTSVFFFTTGGTREYPSATAMQMTGLNSHDCYNCMSIDGIFHAMTYIRLLRCIHSMTVSIVPPCAVVYRFLWLE